MRRFIVALVMVVLGLVVMSPEGEAAAGTQKMVITASSLVSVTAADECLTAGGLLEGQHAPQVQPANTFSVIGDSWGFLFYGAFVNNMHNAGYGDYVYRMRAVPGTEASQWASDLFPCSLLMTLIRPIVKNDTGTPRVLVSLGGNDLVNDYGELGDGVYERIETDLREIVDELIAVNPNVQIIFSGYDIVNMEKNQYCIDWSISNFGSAEPELLNPKLIQLGDAQGAVAADYPDNVYYANVFGALQGTPGNPDITLWSPLPYFTNYVGWEEDCIHMNRFGYDVFTDALVDWMETNGVIGP